MTGCLEEFIIATASAIASCMESMSVSYSSTLVVLEYVEESANCSRLMGIGIDVISRGNSIYTGLLYLMADESTRSISLAAVLGLSIRTESTVMWSKIFCWVSKSRTL